MSPYEESLIARSLAGNTGRLPDGSYPPLSATILPVRGSGGGDKPVVLPLRKIRSLTDSWRHAGKVVEIGQEMFVPADEARGLVNLGRAEYVKA